MDTLSQKFLQKRKFFLVLPLLVLPFVTLVFWALGGGSFATNEKQIYQGLDLTLPEPNLKNQLEGKLSLYEQAEKKARRLKEAKAADPYSRTPKTDSLKDFIDDNPVGFKQEEYPLNTHAFEESRQTEAKLRRQLEDLKAQINTPPDLEQYSKDNGEKNWPDDTEEQPAWRPPVTGLKDASMSTNTTDPELQQLDNMLTKILDIEHPQRVRERLQQQSLEKRGLVFPVETKPDIPQANLLEPSKTVIKLADNQFYESGNDGSSQYETAIPAAVHETQTLVSGATLKLRLTETIFINGLQVPTGTFIFGICGLDGERLTVNIQHIRYKNALLPVNLSVFDMDGIAGIRIPGAISRDAAKQGMNNGIQSMDFYNMDPSLGAQAASAGIQTFKSLLGNKAKLIKATIRAGYPVLLVDYNKRN